MSFYYVRLADKPIHYLKEGVRFRNLILTNEFDSPELVASLIHRMGFDAAKPGTTVVKTSEAILVTQHIVIKMDKRPTIQELECMNAAADKALFDATLVAKTNFDAHGNRI